jgi:hypothetical protein
MSNTDALSGARDLAWRERPLEGLRVLELGPVKMPGLVPKLSETPGGVEWYGGLLGAHNEDVYGGLLGLSAEEIERLSEEGVI